MITIGDILAIFSAPVVICAKILGIKSPLNNNKSYREMIHNCEYQVRLMNEENEKGVAIEAALNIANSDIAAINKALATEIIALKKALLVSNATPHTPSAQVVAPLPNREINYQSATRNDVLELPAGSPKQRNYLSIFWPSTNKESTTTRLLANLQRLYDTRVQTLDESHQLQAIAVNELDKAKIVTTQYQVRKSSC